MAIIILLFVLVVNSICAGNTLKILIVGSGAREHALAWTAAQSPQVSKVFVAPGNGGTSQEPKVENCSLTTHDELVNFAKSQCIDLTIIGPEMPLAQGIVDLFYAQNLRCFGPTKAAAKLESSKVFAKRFMNRHQIPTASYQSFTNFDDASYFIKQQQAFPIVIKADGLAAGKGVIIAQNAQEAIDAAHAMLIEHTFGHAGNEIIIEEFINGQEATFTVISDGIHILPLATSQDHKKVYDGDQGPNTGGMGAYSPAPIITPELEQHILHTVIEPVITGMKQEGIPFCGFLYAGLMICEDGSVKVLEFNCRLGDPEAQPILMRLKTDLVDLCLAACENQLHHKSIEWDQRAALSVVLTSKNYPNSYPKGSPIKGLPETDDHECKIFHAGTLLQNNNFTTAGGRVLCATALGNSLAHAKDKAYSLVKSISWPEIHYRTDIGYHALKEKE